jgi:predicted MFS family arabinose efflux permease
MFSRRLKTGYFTLEGLNSFATVYYFYYFYYFMQKTFGLGNKTNLALAALSGGIYAVFSWCGGRFAQRFGYFTALKLGFTLMPISLAVGLRLHTAGGQIAVMCAAVIGMCFTWPTLEALVSEGEAVGGVRHMVGVYNVVWASTAAVANFTGGAMLEKLGPDSLFYVPITIQVAQLALTLGLESQARRRVVKSAARHSEGDLGHEPASANRPAAALSLATGAPLLSAPALVRTREPLRSPPPGAKTFLRMAWLANPSAYIAINTLVAAMPGVAGKLQLSTMLAGFCCSVWGFARLGAFLGLWYWSGWHYRFRWLLLAYLILVGSFASILLTPNVAVCVLAQIAFGGAIGLIYYSSLFYSMDLSDTKGEHGGIHEAAIGLGNCAGPAVGAAALQFLPQYGNSAAIAVSLLLLCGLGALTVIWRQGKTA